MYKIGLNLPAQAAAETEATIVKWHVSLGDTFSKGQSLAEAESAKSTFEFEAPCDGKVVGILYTEGSTVGFDTPVIEIETSDAKVAKSASQVAGAPAEKKPQEEPVVSRAMQRREAATRPVSILGIGGYLPKQVITNSDLLEHFPDISEDYIFGVTGIKERRWASPETKPSEMAFAAAQEAIRKSRLKPENIDAIILATTTPEVAMPSTACLLQQRLGIPGIPAFDLSAACSGWLYSLSVAKGLIHSGIGENVLVVSVELQSRLLDKTDRNTYFLFGDGAGAAVVSASEDGHVIKEEILAADPRGIHMARRDLAGFEIPTDGSTGDPWIRLDGKALFRFATESFSSTVKTVVEQSGWSPEDVRWVVPHQANGRIIKAAAKKSGVPFERFYLNIDHVGNTSSASIPLALLEIEKYLSKQDKIVLCSVGAGITYAALSLQW